MKERGGSRGAKGGVSYSCIQYIVIFVFFACWETVDGRRSSTTSTWGNTGGQLPQRPPVLPDTDLCSTIDLVYSWVNGSDPKVIADMKKYTPQGVSSGRVRDYGTLLYSIRSAEKYAPWVRKIVIITSGETPSWLNLNSPRLLFLTHKDYFSDPVQSSLPTFNSNGIESQFFNLPDSVAECILYLNDDFFFYNPTQPSDYIQPNTGTHLLRWSGFNAPVPEEKLRNTWHQAVSITSNNYINNWYHPDLIQQGVKPRSDARLQHKYPAHFAYFYKKTVLKEMHKRWAAEMDGTAMRRKRGAGDFVVSFMYAHVVKYDYGGVDHPGLGSFYGTLENDYQANEAMLKRLKGKNPVLVCINDGLDKNAKRQRKVKETPQDQMVRFFETFLPHKSSLEIGYRA